MSAKDIICRYLRTSILLSILVSFVACNAEKKEYTDTPFDKELVPTMVTDSVTELISDSGLIRYRVTTAKWMIFDQSKDPHWFFPEGLNLVQFDTTFHERIELVADTVWNYTRRKLWHLKGNVVVKNVSDERFESQELFLNENTGRFYSNKYIEIHRPGKLMLKGYGFESNQQMTDYRIFRPHDSEMYVDVDSEKNVDAENDGGEPKP